MITVEISKRFVRPPSWWKPAFDNLHDIPKFDPPTEKCSKDGTSLCRRCREKEEDELKRKAPQAVRTGGVKRSAAGMAGAAQAARPVKRLTGPIRKGKCGATCASAKEGPV